MYRMFRALSIMIDENIRITSEHSPTSLSSVYFVRAHDQFQRQFFFVWLPAAQNKNTALRFQSR